MRSWKWRTIAIALICVLVGGGHVTTAQEGAPRYTIVDLGPLTSEPLDPADASCISFSGGVFDMNAEGVVVGFLPKDRTRGNAFVSTGSKLKRLKGGENGSKAYGVNKEGVVAGVVFGEAAPTEVSCYVQGFSPRPVVWEDGVPRELPLPPDAIDAEAYDVNDEGVVIGAAAVGGTLIPVIWSGDSVTLLTIDVTGGPEDLLAQVTDGGGFLDIQVAAIAPNGDIFGNATAMVSDSGIASFGVKWTAPDYELSVIAGAQSFITSGNGTIAGGIQPNADGVRVPMVWVDGTAIALPLSSDATAAGSGSVTRISDDGHIISGVVNSGGETVATIWVSEDDPANAEPYRLSDLVDELGDVTLTGAIVGPGGDIAATGIDNATGQEHVYRLETVD